MCISIIKLIASSKQNKKKRTEKEVENRSVNSSHEYPSWLRCKQVQKMSPAHTGTATDVPSEEKGPQCTVPSVMMQAAKGK